MGIKVCACYSFGIQNKFRVRYGLGKHELRRVAVVLADMNWSWPALKRTFLRGLIEM